MVSLINVKDNENGQNFQKLKLFCPCTNPHTTSRQLIGKKLRNQVRRRKKQRDEELQITKKKKKLNPTNHWHKKLREWEEKKGRNCTTKHHHISYASFYPESVGIWSHASSHHFLESPRRFLLLQLKFLVGACYEHLRQLIDVIDIRVWIIVNLFLKPLEVPRELRRLPGGRLPCLLRRKYRIPRGVIVQMGLT